MKAQPVAIVGMACRLPGANNIEEFLRLLRAAADTVGEVPPSRWKDAGWYDPDPGAFGGRPPYRWGGFVDDMDMFDAKFFGVSPARAIRMDPQQRILLETSWEAFEHAGWLPADLAGSRTGVFLGAQSIEYGEIIARDTDLVDGITALSGMTILSAVLSHTYDLRGPSMTIDTACSSSLVAAHQAVRSLRAGECDQALVCGTNLLLDPGTSLSLARGNMLSGKGKCHSFGAAADGYARAEGVAVVLLKLQEQARKDGDRCYATILGTAVNQDGRTGAITAPSAKAQVTVIRDALDDAGLTPADLGYVECHGTGTPVGDDIEAHALAEAVKADRTQTLPIGSVKSNIGHTEAASGAVGLIKLALMLHNEVMPATLHCDPPNPKIPMAELGIQPVAATREWPAGAAKRVAGINSFGFGGTNAHAVLVEADVAANTAGEPEAAQVEEPMVLPLSARSPAALRGLVERWSAGLADPESLLHKGVRDAVYTATALRTHHAHRVSVVGRDAASLGRRLRSVSVPDSKPYKQPARVAFVYTGQGGSQWADLCGQLLDTEPEFAETVRRCDEVAGWSISDMLRDGVAADRTDLVQPCMFAVQAGLTELWLSAGIEPVAVLGHSSGEVAAAHAAGVLSLEEACELAIARGRTMASTHGLGRMLAAGIDESRADSFVPRGVYVAAVNGPGGVVLSGPADAIVDIADDLRAEGVRVKPLPGQFAFHHPMMASAADELAQLVAGIVPGPGRIPFFSSVRGAELPGGELDADYWRSNVLNTVRFADAVHAMLDDKVEAFVEIGPRPVLARSIDEVARARNENPPVLGCFGAGRADREGLLETLGALYTLGHHPTWERFIHKGQKVDLPGYPWDRKRYWMLDRVRSGQQPAPREDETGHPLVREKIDLAVPGGHAAWQAVVDTRRAPEFLDHKVGDLAVLPGVTYVELMVAAAREHGLGDQIEIRDLAFHQMLIVDDSAACTLQVTIGPDGAASVHSRSPKGTWIQHATGTIGTWTGEHTRWQEPEGLAPMATKEIYRVLGTSGLSYGTAFATLRDSWRASGVATARSMVLGQNRSAYHFDPRILDSALQLSVAAVDGTGSGGVPLGFDRVRVSGQLGSNADVNVRVRGSGAQEEVDAQLDSRDGCCTMEGARFHMISARETQSTRTYELEWRAAPRPAGTPSGGTGRWVLVGPDTSVGEFAQALRSLGREVAVVAPDTSQAEFDRLFERDVRGVVLLGESGPDDLPRYAHELTAQALRVVRAVVRTLGRGGPEIWLAARAEPAHSPLRGLARALNLELPALTTRYLELDDLEPGGVVDVVRELLDPTDESLVAFRGGQRFVSRLVPATLNGTGQMTVDPEGAYLITGGTGGLGLEVARLLVEAGAGEVALLARNVESPAARAAVQELSGTRTRISLLAADCGDAEQVAAALTRLRAGGRALRGVVHSAGVVRDGSVLTMSTEALSDVLRPKVYGGWYLHEQTASDPLDWFVLFSSLAAISGSPGQANYCAANAFLDGLAEHRRARGMPATTINWGAWAEVGMAARDGSGADLIGMIEVRDGVRTFERIMADGRAQTVAIAFDARELAGYHADPVGASLYADFGEVKREATPTHNGTDGTDSAGGTVRERIAEQWCRALGADSVGDHENFFEIGGDSIFAYQIVTQVSRAFDVTIDPEEIFADFTVARMVELVRTAQQTPQK